LEQLPSLGVKASNPGSTAMKKLIELLDDEDRIFFKLGLMLMLLCSHRLYWSRLDGFARTIQAKRGPKLSAVCAERACLVDAMMSNNPIPVRLSSLMTSFCHQISPTVTTSFDPKLLMAVRRALVRTLRSKSLSLPTPSEGS